MSKQFEWSPLRFGKHIGKTLPQVVLSDPDWFFWAVGNSTLYGSLADESFEIAAKATHIKIPKPDPENWRVEYKFYYADNSFVDFSIIAAQTAIDHSLIEIGTHLDLSVARRHKNYDKSGCTQMLRRFRQYYYGGSNLTKERCENFFYTDANFVL